MLAGFRNYITSNENDCIRTDVIADNFEAAGGKGNISTLSNDAIAESLAAHGVSEKRPELEIPAVETIGNPPTSGYSNDPVNTATGNFVENEEDLRFEGASALLGWARSYSSLNKKVGGHGLGWASFDGCDLRFTEDGATWTLVDGREVFFPRLGDGFGRAAHDNYWLAAGEHGFVVSNNGGAKWEHGTSGRLTSFTLGDGASIFFDHDPAGRLVRVRHSRGRQIDLEWADDRISAVQGDDGSRVEYRYIDGHLVEAEGPLGSRRYEWDEHGLIATVIDGDGVTLVHNTYDDEGRVVKQISPYGRATRFGYLPGRVTVVSDVDGSRSNSWLADSRGRVVGIIDSDGNRSSMAYDRWGNQVFSRDPEGQVTVREFDDHGRLVTELLPSGAMTRLEHDHLGRLTAIISLEDEVEVTRTSMAYDDGRQQPSVIVDGEGGRTQLHWDEGLLLDVVDPVGVRVDFEYDSRGDLVASVDADGNTTRLVRDASGRVIELVKPSGATTRYEYTAAGLLSARTDPDGAVWRYDYTTGGRLAGFINPLGERTALEYGSHGEPCAVIDPLGRRVEQEFDDLGNISRVRLPDGATWEFTHDAMSRLRHTVDPSGGVWQRHYDQFGRLNETRDPTGVRWFQHHNTALREITAGDNLASITVRKDRWGRQVSETLPDGSTTFTRYDRAGRVVELVDAVGARTSIERDLAGRVVQIRRPSGGTLRYDYDVCGRVAGVRNELGFRTELGYDVDSQLVRELWPTGGAGLESPRQVWSRHCPIQPRGG